MVRRTSGWTLHAMGEPLRQIASTPEPWQVEPMSLLIGRKSLACSGSGNNDVRYRSVLDMRIP
jgi:hypothetical protein